MKKQSMMSVNKMIDLYLTYGLDEKTWGMMYEMTCHGLISNENWKEFFETCKDWTWSDDYNAVINGEGKALYHYDNNGYLVKVA